jgi:lysophospholipase L1-like esterase
MPSQQLELRADLIYARDLLQLENPPLPNDPAYGWHLLAEGDSWFTIGAVPSSNLLFELRLARWTRILTLAYPGDTVIHMGQLANNPDLRKYVGKLNFNYPFHAFLLSGGGNDVIDAAPRLIRPDKAPAGAIRAEDHIDQAELDTLLTGIRNAYAQIVSIRDSADSKSKGAPIIVHTYDYPTPRAAPAMFVGAIPVLGPWLHKAFKGSGLDIVLQQQIVNLLMDKLADTLLSMDARQGSAATRLPAFHVIDTRNTLIAANPTEIGNSNDWLNEIHPNMDGYRKIAARLSMAVNEILLAR